jgi:ribosomal protein S18 acetylase RimI-like enzyme
MHTFLRPAEKTDYAALLNFTKSLNYFHRHLDWRDSLEWLGRAPFWILEENQRIQAALACPPEPEDVAWVRMFGVSMQISADRAWKLMFEKSFQELHALEPRPMLVSLSLREWYEELLQRNGFQWHQDIVVYVYDDPPPPPREIDPRFTLRDMHTNDLPGVKTIDNLAFEPIWRLSNNDLQFSVKKSSYCTVVEQEGEIVAYQISSSSGMYAHLARLAVHPALQRQRIGYALLQNLLQHFIGETNHWGVTLNTQHNNASSIALYRKTGFRETGERFPVFVYPYS